MAKEINESTIIQIKAIHLTGFVVGIFSIFLAIGGFFYQDIKSDMSSAKTEQKEWKKEKFDPLVEKVNDIQVNIGTLLERTNSFERLNIGNRPYNHTPSQPNMPNGATAELIQ